MVFKRRDKRPIFQIVKSLVYPRGGWTRAFHYVKHRVNRLPDTPEKIARGIWAGVFTTFTPFYGLHFFIAAGISVIMRGNVLASLLATFFGNPLTSVPIAVVSLQTGHFLLGTKIAEGSRDSLAHNFSAAAHDLWHNFISVFTGRTPEWSGLARFWDEVFFPYMIGGILPGVVAATVCYYLSVPIIRAYQNRRRKGVLKAKLAALKKKKKPADGAAGTD